MQIKCNYCDNYISDTETVCPYCNAPNPGVKRTADATPHTIEQLKAFVRDNNIPVDRLRFFIDQDYKEAKAFGIYKDEATGNFVVYKNKGNGERAVRYEGKDEAYAVNEIYQKLIERKNEYTAYNIENNGRRSSNYNSGNTGSSSNRGNGRKNPRGILISIAIILFIIFIGLRCSCSSLGSLFLGGGGGSGYYSSYDSDYDSGNDSDWDSDWGSDWDSDWGGDWDSDW